MFVQRRQRQGEEITSQPSLFNHVIVAEINQYIQVHLNSTEFLDSLKYLRYDVHRLVDMYAILDIDMKSYRTDFS